jgi:hypothetical protein
MTIAQTFEDICGMPDKAQEWYVKRTEVFPDSAKAWYALATRRFYPLMPDPESGLPYNDDIDPSQRIEIADEVIAMLEKATAIEPKYRDPFVWRSMAHTQKSFARMYSDPPETPEDAIELIMRRRDTMLAWREQKAVCDIEKIPDCPFEVDEAADPPAIKPGVVFRELAADGSAWKDKEINLWGKVVGDTVEKLSDGGGYVWEFDLDVRYAPMPVDGSDEGPEVGPDEGQDQPAPDSSLDEGGKARERVKIRYTFLKPEVAPGEPVPDTSAEIQAQIDVWKRLKSTPFSGFIERKDGELLLSSAQKPPVGCCPPAPLTAEEEKSDGERLEELRAEIAAIEQGKDLDKGKGKGKGKGR